ncbi:MAG: MBL fold metallo-hydrolase [Acidimicrobiales bacterium]
MGTTTDPWAGLRRRLTDAVTVLEGADKGAYPSGNSVVVQGRSETLIIDPSITVAAKGVDQRIDLVLNSHAHEDHIAGNGTFTDARVAVHHDDVHGVQSIEPMLDAYHLTGERRDVFAQSLLDEFHFTPRPDAEGFGDGDVFDLGGISVEAVHLPGHTAGHSGFRIDGGVFFCSDVDLTGFGPYYGDTWSDLDQFEASIEKLRHEEADVYVTFHHKGVIEGRDDFLQRLDAFGAVIERRHTAMLDYLAEPRTVDDLVAHRFVYRPHVDGPFTENVERRTAELHLARMLDRGEATATDDGSYVRV